MRPLVAGNWKMNGLASSLKELEAVTAELAANPAGCEALVCPPFTLLAQAVGIAKGVLAVGGQDCHAQPSGPHTGDIAAEMLKDAGASYVILGHSERRRIHGETDALVMEKTKAAWAAGLSVIICVGESDAEREAGRAHAVCHGQIEGSVPKGATSSPLILRWMVNEPTGV